MSSHAEGSEVSDLPAMRELPDPFRMNDGSRVETKQDWRRRREEIQGLLLQYEYGRIPPADDAVALDFEAPAEVRNDGKTSFRELRLKMGPESRITMTLHVYLPSGHPGPFPTILRVGLGCPIVGEINERGYAFAAFEHRDLDPETEGYDVAGPAQAAYPEYDWGSIAVWAWGASRTLDYLLTCPWVSEDQVIVTGHSRTGKAALLAGALDERFGMVAPNGSGCGGASCYRIAGDGAETLEMITRKSRFASWFQKDFGRFGGHEERLPFDQHFVKALVAPRMLLTTDALDDKWANPLGNQAAYLAVQPVYDFLGAGQNSAMHFREGQHDQLAEDFRAILDFADHHFAGKPLKRSRSVLPFPDYGLSCSWLDPDARK